MTKKILLLGGTGAMGVYLREYLAQEPDTQVYITSRSEYNSSGNIHYICGNAKNIDFLKEILLNIKPDAIVDFMIWNTEQFKEVSSLLLQNTAHYLFLSSYRVFAEDNPLIESSPRLLDVCQDAVYLKTDEYALTKARQENILRQSSKNNWTILRPCITYSKNRFQLGCWEADVVCLRSLQGLSIVLPSEMLDKQTTMTWAGDTALLIAKLILNPSAYGEDFNLATAEHHTWREISGYYSEILGTNIYEIPLEKYIKQFGFSYQLKYDRMFNRILDNSKVLAVTGISQSQFTSLKEGLTRELISFKTNPVYKSVNIIPNAKMDNICGERISLKGLSLRNILLYLAVRCHLFPFLLLLKGLIKRK